MDPYSRHAMRVSVAQICQIIGWTSIHTSPLEILTDILQEYITGLGKVAARYAMLFGQCEPNLHHVALAFQDMGISISELEEYVTFVESSSVLEVPKYPIPKESHLNHLKPGSREVVTRPFHIHEHLPPMHPHLEDQEYKSPLTVEVSTSDNLSPLSSPKSIFKKPGDPISSDPRRGRSFLDDEVRSLREISSVMMTTSGFLSPAREGKLPEARTQPIEFSNPSSPETPQTSQSEQLPPSPQQQPQQQPPPPPPPPPQPLPTEVKAEKKKKTKGGEGSTKKTEKENKAKEELLSEAKDSEDDPKGKKLAIAKETSKLKAFKTGALKMQSKPPSPAPSPPPQKKAKLSPNSSQTIMKSGKIKSPKTDKRPMSPLVKDILMASSIKDSTPDVDIKLPSEPDKQKLNIFKKITKVKDDYDDSKSFVADHRESNPSLVDTPLASQKKTIGDSNIKESHEEVDAPINVETITPPRIPDNVSEHPVLDKTPEVVKVSEPKKKKRDKQKEKKEIPSETDQASKSKYLIEETGKVKTLAGTDVSFLGGETEPPVIPALSASSWSNPSLYGSTIPPISISSSGSIVSAIKKDIVPSSGDQATILPSSSNNTPLAGSSTSFPEKDGDSLIVKKKLKKDKKIKDKIKKKKDKKDKNKAKDKSERKKLKLEKKEKAKLKLKKEKKEKKKEKEVLVNRGFEHSHIAEDVLNTLTPWASDIVPSKKLKLDEKDDSSGLVPKITFKLGPASPKDVESPGLRKIVIKPIVKKEEENVTAGSSAAQEAPKTPQVIPPKIKSHKSGKSSQLPKNDSSEPSSFLASDVIPFKSDAFPSVAKWESDLNQSWICPACGVLDDGSAMIACDKCDFWFHWLCVGITEAIDGDWYCNKCISKKDDGQSEKKKKHRKKKN